MWLMEKGDKVRHGLDFVCVVMFVVCFVLFPSGGYKGYGLGMMVEVFCGILAGAQYSNHVRTWKVTDRIANLVRFFFSLLVLCFQVDTPTSCKIRCVPKVTLVIRYENDSE